MSWTHVGGLALACALAMCLAGCRENEQNRPLQLEQGKYQGLSDEKLDNNTRQELLKRANLMR